MCCALEGDLVVPLKVQFLWTATLKSKKINHEHSCSHTYVLDKCVPAVLREWGVYIAHANPLSIRLGCVDWANE